MSIAICVSCNIQIWIQALPKFVGDLIKSFDLGPVVLIVTGESDLKLSASNFVGLNIMETLPFQITTDLGDWLTNPKWPCFCPISSSDPFPYSYKTTYIQSPFIVENLKQHCKLCLQSYKRIHLDRSLYLYRVPMKFVGTSAQILGQDQGINTYSNSKMQPHLGCNVVVSALHNSVWRGNFSQSHQLKPFLLQKLP